MTKMRSVGACIVVTFAGELCAGHAHWTCGLHLGTTVTDRITVETLMGMANTACRAAIVRRRRGAGIFGITSDGFVVIHDCRTGWAIDL